MKKLVITLLVLVFSIGPVFGNEQYQDNVVLVGTSLSGYGTLQNATQMVESMLGINLEVQDTANFICMLPWPPDTALDMAIKMSWETQEVSVPEVVDAFTSLDVHTQPNCRYELFYNVKPIPPPKDNKPPLVLDFFSRFQTPYPLGGEDPKTGLCYTRVVEAWQYAEGTEEVVLQINDTGVFWWIPEYRGMIWENLGEDSDGDGSVLIYSEDGYAAFDPGDVNGIDDDGNGLPDDFIGWDFKDWDNDPAPPVIGMECLVHGHAVASIAAARVGNGGMWGVAGPPIKIQCVRVGAYSGIYTWEAMQGLGYPVFTDLRGAHLAGNFSWGSYWGGDWMLKHQFECFTEEGEGLAVFAAGNGGNEWGTWPAYWHFGPIVCATDRQNGPAWFTTRGPWIHPDGLSFPGDSILVMRASTDLSGVHFSYTNEFYGTSWSAPAVAALASTFWSMYPELTVEEVKTALLTNVYPSANYPGINPDPFQVDDYIGTGISDAFELMYGLPPGQGNRFLGKDIK
jgi:hypothetical protein